MNFDNYVKIVKDKLSPRRFAHSLRVVDTAMSMAEGAGLDMDKVYLAALLHDYAKGMPPGELLALAKDNHLMTCEAEAVQPDLLHGPVGAWLCRRELQIIDEEVLQAIHYHTTGRAGMSSLEIVVYLADLIEPGRTYHGIRKLQETCKENMNQGLLLAFDFTIQFILSKKLLLHPQTVEARNWILLNINKQ